MTIDEHCKTVDSPTLSVVSFTSAFRHTDEVVPRMLYRNASPLILGSTYREAARSLEVVVYVSFNTSAVATLIACIRMPQEDDTHYNNVITSCDYYRDSMTDQITGEIAQK